MRLAMIAVQLVPAACSTMKSPVEWTLGTATAEPLDLEALRAGGAACPSVLEVAARMPARPPSKVESRVVPSLPSAP
jgi:hypothetical protein